MRFFLLLTFSLVSSAVLSQDIWTNKSSKTYELHTDVLTYELEKLVSKEYPEILIPFPTENGIEDFKIVLNEVLSPALQAKFPFIHSFKGKSVDSNTSINITCNNDHFSINMVQNSQPLKLINKRKNFYSLEAEKSVNARSSFTCNTAPKTFGNTSSKKKLNTLSSYIPSFTPDKQLRTIRFALAVTAEASAYFIRGRESASTAEKKAIVLEAISVSLLRINEVFARDLGVKLELIENNDEIIFLETNDPFTNIITGRELTEIRNQAQTTIDNIIGSPNYDLGHILASPRNGSTGEAAVGSICDNFSKAKGITASDEPEGANFDFTLFAHEIGHQLGGNHTFNADCPTNARNNFTAVEVNSGTTIMGYSGACGIDDIQPNSDPFFHTVSIDEILNKLLNTSCNIEKQLIANNLPIVEPIPSSYNIPLGTPFYLDVSATDPDGDSLTYSWEQLDTDIASTPPLPTDAAGPLFRVYNPTSNSRRDFPSPTFLNRLLKFEVIPEVSRSMTFIALIRDGKDQGISYSNPTTVNTIDSTPFTINLPKDAAGDEITSLSPSTTINLTWQVGNTNKSPVNTENVSIEIINYNTGEELTLVESTPNDGNQDIEIPVSITGDGYRFRINAVNNIFYNVSNMFSVGLPQNTDFILTNSQDKTSNHLIFNIKKQTPTVINPEIILTFSNGISGEVLNLTLNDIEISFNGTNYNALLDNTISANSYNDSFFIRIPLNENDNISDLNKIKLDATFVNGENISKAPHSIGDLNPLELNFKDSISIYPIPVVNERVTIESAFTLKNGDFIDVSIFDITGKLVQNNSISETVEQISVSELASGVYFLHLEKDGKSNANFKILVE